MQESQIRSLENRLFFKRWLKSPKQLGTAAPISPRLANLAARAISYTPGTPIVEIGAGTGRLTRSLLAAGVEKEDLTIVELDPEMCDFLDRTIPGARIVQGDATFLPKLIPDSHVGKVCTVVSAIPLMYLSPEQRMSIVKSAFDVMPQDGIMVHVTYNPRSPLQGVTALPAHRHGAVWLNFPPGFVWTYRNGGHPSFAQSSSK